MHEVGHGKGEGPTGPTLLPEDFTAAEGRGDSFCRSTATGKLPMFLGRNPCQRWRKAAARKRKGINGRG